MSNAKDLFVDFPAGAAVFREGDAGSDMFIIESGQIDIVQQGAGDEVMASLGPGDFFGEAAILDDGPRYATALAKTPSRVLRIERAAFVDVLRQNVEIAVRIMRKMMSRQRRTEQRLHEALNELLRLKAVPAVPRAEAPRPPPPVAREAVPPPPPPKPKPEPVVAAPVAPPPPPPRPSQLALRAADGQVLPLDGALSEFLIGRPDPVTGIHPEINLGPFDGNRTISRRHAKILREGGLYSVREEVGTSNGTFVNGERVKTGVAVPLKPGDKLRFGMVEVEVVVV